MGNIACNNYYFEEILLKPEWFSDNSWNIQYKYMNENTNKITNEITNENTYEIINEISNENIINKPPYTISKGVLTFNNANQFNLLISKKLLVNLSILNSITIPLHFFYSINKELNINMFIIFSKNNIEFDDILNFDFFKNTDDSNEHFIKYNKKNKLYFTNIILKKNNFKILNSYSNDIIKYKLDENCINKYTIFLENNIDLLLIKNKLSVINNYDKKTINDNNEKKYVIPNIFGNNNDSNIYLSIYIYSNTDFKKNDFFKLYID
jgi:transcriptional regulator CtsR